MGNKARHGVITCGVHEAHNFPLALLFHLGCNHHFHFHAPGLLLRETRKSMSTEFVPSLSGQRHYA